MEIPMQPASYPVSFTVDYPDRDLNRLTTLFRIFVAIPILIVLGTVSGQTSTATAGSTTVRYVAAAGGILFAGPLLMILFRRKYPRWWFDWNLEFQRFSSRVSVYLALMDDQYPSTDEHQSVYLDYRYPDVETDLNRWPALGEVAARDSSLHRPVLFGYRSHNRGDRNMVCHFIYRALPTAALRLRRRRVPLEQSCTWVCHRVDYRRISPG
jgi:hypothetical protein